MAVLRFLVRSELAESAFLSAISPQDASAIMARKLTRVDPSRPTPAMKDDRLDAQFLGERWQPPFVRLWQVRGSPDSCGHVRLSKSRQELAHAMPVEAFTTSRMESFPIQYLSDLIA